LSLPWRRPALPPARKEWREILRSRLTVSAIVFALWTTAIEARLLYLQVYRHDDMMARANKQQLRTLDTPAKRGDLLDRNGEVLATSVDADTITADPSTVADLDGLAQQVCAALTGCDAAQQEAMAERLRKGDQFAFLARQVDRDDALRVKSLGLPGLGFIKESRRYYPNRRLAAHVLGYVGLDNKGLGGVEFAYDKRIRGREGVMLLHVDAKKQAMFTREERPPTAGDGVELTIDQYLQHIAERELRAGVEENRAAGGTAIVMQPATGEILALANWPSFNPNAFAQADAANRRNRATQETYEPGSTFKIVTASAALEEQVILPQDPVDCSPGHITFGSRVINDTHRYGVLPFTDVIVKSSNVGAIKVGLRLGPERLGRYVDRFGFGQILSPDFRGASPGKVWTLQEQDQSALASVSMGYQISVTPLQMAVAASVIANGGSLVEPRVVRAFIRNGHREEVAPKTLRRAITPETAATLTQIMEQVVERGTAQAAQIGGYTIAGKTGTAAKLVNGAYSKSDYNASFVGFAPSRNPALTIIVVIDSPHARGYYGGVVAAPIFQRIADAALRHLGVVPNLHAPPPVLVARNDPEEDIMPRPAVAPVTIEDAVEPTPPGVMPDVRGLSAREALRSLTRHGLTPRMTGDGFVMDQSPAPGAPLTGDGCVLKLGRGQAAAAGGSQ
jgi:cell division protein FtsI (penicillin-binding protein 3)